MSKALSLQDILGVSDAVIEEVHIPEWNGTVYLRSMTSAARDRYEATVFRAKESGNMKGWEGLRAQVVASCLCDQKGNLLFPEGTQDWQKLKDKNSLVISRVFEVCMTISGMGSLVEGESEADLNTVLG